LPNVAGLEVLQQIKVDPELKARPVVMLTSSREERDILRNYDLGTNAFVVKPMSFRDFGKTVREIGHFWGASLSHRASWGAIPRGLARY
jgi:CheY-like chemotaxis protein